MNIIVRHTLRSIAKNPLQSVIIVFSIVLITACLLFAFCVRSLFYTTTSLWAETQFVGSDVRLRLNGTTDGKDIDAALDGMAELVADSFALGYTGGHAVRFGDETVQAQLYFVDDLEKMQRLSGAEVMETCAASNGLVGLSVSRKFAEVMGISLGDTAEVNVSGTPLDVKGTGYVDVQVTQICNDKRSYYNNSEGYRVFVDIAGMPWADNVALFNIYYIYCNNDATVSDGSSVADVVAERMTEALDGKLSVDVDNGSIRRKIDDNVSNSMRTLAVAVTVVVLLMAVLLYFSFSVVVRNRVDELVRFKAAGATPLQNVLILFAELALYVVVGCCLGLAAGAGVVKLLESLLRTTVADAVINVAVWKYFAAAAIAVLATGAACIVPALRMSLKSVHALKSGSEKIVRRVPVPVAIVATLLFAGAIIWVFLADEATLMAAVIVFLCVTVFWVAAVMPYILRGVGFVVGRIVARREAHIAAMEIPNNAGVNTVAVLFGLLLTFVWTGYSIIAVVKTTAVPAYSRYTSDFVATRSIFGLDEIHSRLEYYLSLDGITDGSYTGSLGVYGITDADGNDYEKTVTAFAMPDGNAWRYVSGTFDEETARRFDEAEHPVIMHYYVLRDSGLEVGDKITIRTSYLSGGATLAAEFEIVGVDYTFTNTDNVIYLRDTDLATESGTTLYAGATFWLNGDTSKFAQLREYIDCDTATLYKNANYYPRDDFNEIILSILDAFAGMLFLIAAVGLVNLIAVTATEREHEMSVYRLSGMTAGGAFGMVAAEGALISVVGFCTGLLLCSGVNQLVPAIAGLVNKYLPRTPFDVDILFICLAGAALTFVSWMVCSAAAIVSGGARRRRRISGWMTE